MTIQQLFKTAPITTLLLISFVGLFLIQLLTGVDANNPTTEQLLYWGANALPLTMADEPWRLVTSGFLHIGLMHLLFNAFAMYFFGQVAEPMFGSAKFLALFLLSAIGGNMLNSHITWQEIITGTGGPGLSAGASGGIMGIGGALLVAALFKISVNGRILKLKSLVLIMGINLVYGFAVPGIDNAGHIGGAITGGLIAMSFGIAYRHYIASLPAPYLTAYTNYQMVFDKDINFYNQPYTGIKNEVNIDQNSNYIDTDTLKPVNSSDNMNESDNVDKADTPYKANHYRSPNFDISYSAVNTAPIIIENKKATSAKPALIWHLLPWITMVIIAIIFTLWWQDIHNQLLQVIASQQAALKN